MCDQASYDLPQHAQAAGIARQLVTAYCRRWELTSLSDDAELAVSELVANALIHAGGAAVLAIGISRGFLQISVRDANPRRPIVRPARRDMLADLDRVSVVDAELQDLRGPAWHVGASGSIAAGRGMLIIDAVAEEWGVTQLESGKDVWVRMRLTHPHHPPCPCPTAPAHASA